MIKNTKKIFWLFLTLWFYHSVYASTIINNVRIAHAPDYTRVVLESNHEPNYQLFTLAHPHRLVLDIKSAEVKFALNQLNYQNSLVQNIRQGGNSEKLRLVFDLNEAVLPKTFLFKANASHGYRLVIDLSTGREQELHQKVKTPTLPASKPYKSAAKLDEQKRDIIVVIDPGHGGKDPGATGSHGIHEKNVVLAISKALAARINTVDGMRAVLTRDGDYYLSLRERLKIARKDQADLFIAIHADAFYNPYSQGASIFALSPRGATSEAARWLAEKENYSELGGIDLADKSDMLRSVLIDLSQTATISQSLDLGLNLLHAMGRVANLHHNKVEQARFVVLKSPDIPSLLIETGYITNAQEERRLSSPAYQQRLANAIAQGIVSYFRVQPPPGTLFSYEKKQRSYIVEPKDTLNLIASRYHVSVAALRKNNNLADNTISVGQVLMLPEKHE